MPNLSQNQANQLPKPNINQVKQLPKPSQRKIVRGRRRKQNKDNKIVFKPNHSSTPWKNQEPDKIIQELSPIKWSVHEVNQILVHNISDTCPESKLNKAKNNLTHLFLELEPGT